MAKDKTAIAARIARQSGGVINLEAVSIDCCCSAKGKIGSAFPAMIELDAGKRQRFWRHRRPAQISQGTALLPRSARASS